LTESMSWIAETAEGILVKVLVQPRAAKNEIVGLQGDMLKVKLTAPPVDGAANRMCRDYVAKALKVRRSQVEMVSGHKSRSKTLLVRSATQQQLQALLKQPVR